MLLGLAWTYLLLAHEWPRHWREKAWVIYASGILLLASTLIVAFASKQRIPFWPDVQEFGFLPNRNQTSNVLGLGGVMIYALGLQQFLESRKYWWLWLASLSIICWALILNYSRAGIILFFFGALAVHAYWWIGFKERRRPLIALGGLIFLVALFVGDGGATLMRFGKETLGFFSPSQNLRLSIYRDAINLIGRVPLLGVGLANFPPIFSVHRHYSVADNDVIHPESDWLWVALELGWLAPLLLLILFVWWIRQCRPIAPGTFRLMRVSAMICGCAFAIHGIFDVSGHRIGSLWPALFLASVALHPNRAGRSAPAISRMFRVIGAFLTCIGVWWLMSILSTNTFPTSASLNRLQKRVQFAADRDDYNTVLMVTSEALRIAPLEWSLYYKRGAAEAALFYSHSATQRDFAVARYLLPYWPNLYFQEGRIWIAVGEPDLGFEAWTEALQRSGQNAPGLYGQMFNVIKSDASLLDRWRELGRANKECLLVFLQNAGPFEFQVELQRLLSEDRQLQSLTLDELKILFSAWYQKGDKLALAETLRGRPEWQKIGWRELARSYADYQDYRQAYEIVRQFAPPPEVPQKTPQESTAVLQSRFKLNPTVDAGLALYFAQMREGQINDALMTLGQLTAFPGSPKYLSYLEAELWAQKGQWKEAWQALALFEFPNR